MHWTYEAFGDDPNLRQGDILEPAEQLLALFEEVHPHFTNIKYRGYLILSQTCDLFRRNNNKCSATHICLSVIRSIQDIISDSLKEKFGYIAPGIYDRRLEKTTKMLAERIINQNESALGLFYLHPSEEAGITVPSVAILRVSISIKAMHYQKLIEARVGRLESAFQPKLGWMVGNLYSRVGVPDWKEKATGEDEEAAVLNSLLSSSRPEPVWLDKKIYPKIISENPEFESLPSTDQTEIIRKYLPPPPKDKILDIIAQAVKGVAPKIQESHLEKIKQRLRNDEQFESQMRKFGDPNGA